MRVAIATALAAVAIGAAALALPSTGAGAGGPPPPNVLLVVVDDQAMNTFRRPYMPETYRWILRRGTKFTAGLAAPPLCCPSRAGILTGQYPHNNNVFSNDPGYASLNGKHNTLPVWLRRAGYRTGFDGKYLNNLSVYQGTQPPPGYDDWFGFLEPPGYYGYAMSDNGERRRFGGSRSQYSTDVITRRAKRFVATDPGQPWFLWLAYNAPHDTTPTIGHCGHSSPLPPTEDDYLIHSHFPLPTPPSFNEKDVSDKPSFISGLHEIPPVTRHHIVTRWKCTLAAMFEVDVQLGKLMQRLQDSGQLGHTIVFYYSDNGYYFGEHRLPRGKSYPYEPALQVPFAVRVPRAYQGVAPPRASPEVVAGQDIAPTILDYAGGAEPCRGPKLCRVLDGRSLRPLLGGDGTWPVDRGVLAEIRAGGPGGEYSAIRTDRYMYARYADGQRELYDLERDPFERTNKAGHPPYFGLEAGLDSRITALSQCSGLTGPAPCE
jgi:arylsulfatase A-like enzyme